MSSKVPCVLFEDEHLLVVNKPAGINTHAPSDYAGEGIYDWLRHRDPAWASLAIMHRLDKETSGILVFSKTTLANRSLTDQFSERRIHKKYLLLSRQRPKAENLKVVSSIVRAGEKYISRSGQSGSDLAETRFSFLRATQEGFLIQAEPVTGKTHQIRVQASQSGIPILGDSLYGGAAFGRLCLHSEELTLRHPATGEELKFRAPADFNQDTRFGLRHAIISPDETNAYRLIHGAADGHPGWYVDRLGEFLLSQSGQAIQREQLQLLEKWREMLGIRGVYHKVLTQRVGQKSVQENSPQHISGEAAPDVFLISENRVQYELSFGEGYSVGIFLDQRDNRRRFLINHVSEGFPVFASAPQQSEVLNAFAYTCAFSVCAAKAGAKVTSLDLSRKYLDWGKRQFRLNGLDPAEHDFIFGDVFEWFRRLAKKGRQFDAIVLDPPTFSRSKERGVFQVEKHYGDLVQMALPLLKKGGSLLCSTNAAKLIPEKFLDMIRDAVTGSSRRTVQRHYYPQPPDFPVSRAEPAYLKTVWLQIE